MAIVLDP